MPELQGEELRSFSHRDFDRVLQRFVNDQGRVDYARLQKDRAELERYYLRVATYSPDSDPGLFPTESSQLAYWINAYNAAVLKTVLTYYPVSSVRDVKATFPLWFLGGKIGFFVFQRPRFGGHAMSLNAVENSVVRKRFGEPRVHFALNGASRGCPRLPVHAFTPEELDAQLERVAQRFFSEERNLHIDDQRRIVQLSAILKWYESDFTGWLERKFPDRDATLLDYVALYVSPERRAELQRAAEYDLEFVPYDWRLNDQNPRE